MKLNFLLKNQQYTTVNKKAILIAATV